MSVKMSTLSATILSAVLITAVAGDGSAAERSLPFKPANIKLRPAPRTSCVTCQQ